MWINDEIISVIKDCYDIDVTNISVVKDGSADVFIIDKKYVLKYYQSDFKLEKILKGIDICTYLYSLNYNVPKYYKTLANEYYFIYKERFGVLMRYVDGESLDAFCATKSQLIDGAQFYAKLELDLMNYPGELSLYDLQDTMDVNSSINQLKGLIKKTDNEKIKKELCIRVKLLKKLNTEFFADVNKVTVCKCHGDFYVSQCIYRNGIIDGILDFESAKQMPITIELIRSYIYFDKNINIDNLVLYISKFNDLFKLNKYDLKYMPYLYYLKLLRNPFGYEQYIKDDIRKEEYLLLGQKIQKQILYLSKNLNKISQKLLDNINCN